MTYQIQVIFIFINSYFRRYNEVCDPGYNFGSDSFSSGTGHFTQVTWKGSTELGIGFGTTKKNGMYCTYVVGRYRPAGNMMGDFPKEVKKGSFSKEKICADGELEKMMSKLGSGIRFILFCFHS